MKHLLVSTFLLTGWSAVAAQDAAEEAGSFFPQQLTARELLTHCVSSSLTRRGREQQRYCRGFVSGVEEALRLSAATSPGATPAPFCVPPGEAARNIAYAYVRYAGRHTTDLERPAALIVVEALKDAYACPP
jgi:hypothetical protein